MVLAPLTENVVLMPHCAASRQPWQNKAMPMPWCRHFSAEICSAGTLTGHQQNYLSNPAPMPLSTAPSHGGGGSSGGRSMKIIHLRHPVGSESASLHLPVQSIFIQSWINLLRVWIKACAVKFACFKRRNLDVIRSLHCEKILLP